MEDVEYVSRTCVVCGKAFTEVKHPNGNKRKFCSHECELKHRREYRRKYFNERYENDAKYREKVKENNAKYGTGRRRAKKEQVLQEIVEALANTTDKEEIRNILEEKLRIKSELYDKHARTLRVSKESGS